MFTQDQAREGGVMSSPDLITIDLARLVGAGTDWSRIFHDYDLLTTAGIPDDEALRIATQAEADRAAETELMHRRAA